MNITFVPFDDLSGLYQGTLSRLRVDGEDPMTGELRVENANTPGQFPNYVDQYLITAAGVGEIIENNLPDTSQLLRRDGSRDLILGKRMDWTVAAANPDEMLYHYQFRYMALNKIEDNKIESVVQTFPDSPTDISEQSSGTEETRHLHLSYPPMEDLDIIRVKDIADLLDFDNEEYLTVHDENRSNRSGVEGMPFKMDFAFSLPVVTDQTLVDLGLSEGQNNKRVVTVGEVEHNADGTGLNPQMWVRADNSTHFTGLLDYIHTLDSGQQELRIGNYDLINIGNLINQAFYSTTPVVTGMVIHKLTDPRNPPADIHPAEEIVAHGQRVHKAMYPKLYEVLGNAYNPDLYKNGPNGKPWCQQYEINDNPAHLNAPYNSVPVTDFMQGTPSPSNSSEIEIVSGSFSFPTQHGRAVETPRPVFGYDENDNIDENLSVTSGGQYDTSEFSAELSAGFFVNGNVYSIGGFRNLRSWNTGEDTASDPVWLEEILPELVNRGVVMAWSTAPDVYTGQAGFNDYVKLSYDGSTPSSFTITNATYNVLPRIWENLSPFPGNGPDHVDSVREGIFKGLSYRHSPYSLDVLHYADRLYFSCGYFLTDNGVWSNKINKAVVSIPANKDLQQIDYDSERFVHELPETLSRSNTSTGGPGSIAITQSNIEIDRMAWQKSIVIDKKIYLIGCNYHYGTTASSTYRRVDLVLMADINPDGSIDEGSWEFFDPMPVSLDEFGIFLTTEWLYIFGGFSNWMPRSIQQYNPDIGDYEYTDVSVVGTNLYAYRCKVDQLNKGSLTDLRRGLVRTNPGTNAWETIVPSSINFPDLYENSSYHRQLHRGRGQTIVTKNRWYYLGGVTLTRYYDPIEDYTWPGSPDWPLTRLYNTSSPSSVVSVRTGLTGSIDSEGQLNFDDMEIFGYNKDGISPLDGDAIVAGNKLVTYVGQHQHSSEYLIGTDGKFMESDFPGAMTDSGTGVIDYRDFARYEHAPIPPTDFHIPDASASDLESDNVLTSYIVTGHKNS